MWPADKLLPLLSTTLTVIMVQAAPQAEQTVDPCSYINWFLHVMMVVVALGALAMATLPVLFAFGSFLWHITLLCVMSAALLTVWYAYQVNICPCNYLSNNTMSALLDATAETAVLRSCLNSVNESLQAGCNTSMTIMRSVSFKWVAAVWDIIRGTDRQQVSLDSVSSIAIIIIVVIIVIVIIIITTIIITITIIVVVVVIIIIIIVIISSMAMLMMNMPCCMQWRTL